MLTSDPALRAVTVLVFRGGSLQNADPSFPEVSKPQKPDVRKLSVKSGERASLLYRYVRKQPCEYLLDVRDVL
jgi:hypothetical protein